MVPRVLSDQIYRGSFRPAAFPISGSSHRFLEQTQGRDVATGHHPYPTSSLTGVNFDTRRRWSDNTMVSAPAAPSPGRLGALGAAPVGIAGNEKDYFGKTNV